MDRLAKHAPHSEVTSPSDFDRSAVEQLSIEPEMIDISNEGVASDDEAPQNQVQTHPVQTQL